ncbi:MAG: PH domain-containing protein [Oscillospiraceae bacterium]|nr:PH domain-containing protein [Oscillospiraceae bacterium]
MAKNDIDCIWRDRKRTFLGLPWSFTVYFLTETKLICRTGIFNLEEEEIDLYKITDKKLKLPFGQRMFGCGTIHICSRDVDAPEFDITAIKQPREVLNLLDKHINMERDRYGTRGRDLYGGAPGQHHHDPDDDPDDGFFDYENPHHD